MAAMSKPVPGNPQNALVNHAASASVDELGECQRLIDTDGRAIGEFSLTIVLTGADLTEVKRAVSRCHNLFAARGGALTEERYNLVSAWLATLPGNGAYNLRRTLLFDTNHADLSMIGTPGTGQAFNEHLKAAHLAILQTREGLPYYFNLHYEDVGHCAIFGSTGSGKSFLVNFKILMLQKYTPFVFIFDLGGSYRRVVEYLDGKHVRVGGEGSGLRFNPFCMPPTPDNLQMLHKLLLVLLGSPEKLAEFTVSVGVVTPNCSVWAPVPVIRSVENVATPLTAVAVSVPASAPVPVAIDAVTTSLALAPVVTTRPALSRTGPSREISWSVTVMAFSNPGPE